MYVTLSKVIGLGGLPFSEHVALPFYNHVSAHCSYFEDMYCALAMDNKAMLCYF